MKRFYEKRKINLVTNHILYSKVKLSSLEGKKMELIKSNSTEGLFDMRCKRKTPEIILN